MLPEWKVLALADLSLISMIPLPCNDQSKTLDQIFLCAPLVPTKQKRRRLKDTKS